MDKDAYIVIAIISFCVAGLVFSVIYSLFSRKKENRKIYEEWEQEPVLSEVKTVGARIIDKSTDIAYVSSAKTPAHKIVFKVCFATDLGQAVTHTVPKEFFEKCSINDYATLATQDGEFLDFV